MTQTTIITILTFAVLILCSLLFLIRSLSASSFRRNIAIPRGFTEAACGTIAYPLWLTSYALLFLQCVSLAAFPSNNEKLLTARLIAYTVTAILFFILREINLPLLAIWFGKNGIWTARGKNGLIKFDNIIFCEISTSKKAKIDDLTALYTLSFFAKDKKIFFSPRKYVCKLSGSDIEKYRTKLPTSDHASHPKHSSKRSRITRSLSYVSLLLIITGTVCFGASTQLTSPYRYNEYETASEIEISSFAPITEAISENGTMIIRYENIEAINVYSETDGSFLWSVSRKYSRKASGDGICAAEGILKYTVGGESRYFVCETGEELTAEDVENVAFPNTDDTYAINFDFTPLYVRRQLSDGSYNTLISNPTAYILFIPSVAWTILVLGIVTLFIWRYLANATVNISEKNPKKTAWANDHSYFDPALLPLFACFTIK